jgi:radical SAM superfamily enzyme YgiQ (UPF0313 family)
LVDVLLVQPPLPRRLYENNGSLILSPPLGLGYIASMLMQNGLSVEVMDMSVLNMELDDFKRELMRKDPKIVGISVETLTSKNALKIAELAKKVDEETWTVLGGPHVTFKDEETLRNPNVDVVVRREGEITMLALAQQILRGKTDLEHVEGITYRKNGQIIRNPDRPLISNLDVLPTPARELFPLNMYKLPGTLITSRGCPAKCIFCSANAISGGRYRIRSPSSVVNEITDMIKKFSFDKFFIADDTFTVFRERTEKICQMLQKLEISWFCESRVTAVNKELLECMAKAGCKIIQFGVESGSEEILKSIRKGITLEQAIKAVKWSIEAGIKPVCSFMVPHPEDTMETIRETKNFMEKLKAMGALVVVSLTTPFPGTYLHDHAEEMGLRIISEDYDMYDMVTPVFATKNLTIEQIEKAFDDLVSVCITQEAFQIIENHKGKI